MEAQICVCPLEHVRVRAFDGVPLKLLPAVSWWDAQQLGAKLLSLSRTVDIPVILPPTPHPATTTSVLMMCSTF